MPEHSRFEELCALAAAGQISMADLAELELHLRECAACRKAQADFVEIASMWPTDTDAQEYSRKPGSTLHQRILSKMQAAGVRFSPPALAESGRRGRIEVIGRTRILAYAVAAAVLLMAGIGLGFAMAPRLFSPFGPQLVVAVPSPAPQLLQPAEHVGSAVRQNAPKLDGGQLTAKLATAIAELARTREQLATAERQLIKAQDLNNHQATEMASLQAAGDQARADATSAQAQLMKFKDVHTAELVAAQYRAHEAETKLADQAAALDRERQLLGAGREIRDIIGARNLHIVDVADVGGGGIEKPFGRVFYTEGKSLIFYAYDLANTKGKQTFTAWGYREGDPRSTRVLGILLNDDQGQKRWSLKLNDTKILAEIDSVFVTLEPSDSPGDWPKGKKLLNAYLGTPANHP